MRSGDPRPIDDLRLIMETKHHGPSETVEVVSEAARWLKAALKGADVQFGYASCEDRGNYGYAAFNIDRTFNGQPVRLELKIAEVRSTPFVFADVTTVGGGVTLFPFFCNIRSEDDRELILHYIADFLLSSDH